MQFCSDASNTDMFQVCGPGVLNQTQPTLGRRAWEGYFILLCAVTSVD
jgi:hypothetical protein